MPFGHLRDSLRSIFLPGFVKPLVSEKCNQTVNVPVSLFQSDAHIRWNHLPT